MSVADGCRVRGKSGPGFSGSARQNKGAVVVLRNLVHQLLADERQETLLDRPKTPARNKQPPGATCQPPHGLDFHNQRVGEEALVPVGHPFSRQREDSQFVAPNEFSGHTPIMYLRTRVRARACAKTALHLCATCEVHHSFHPTSRMRSVFQGPCRGHPCRGLRSPYGQRAANVPRPLPLVPTHGAPRHTCMTVCLAASPTACPCITGCRRPPRLPGQGRD